MGWEDFGGFLHVAGTICLAIRFYFQILTLKRKQSSVGYSVGFLLFNFSVQLTYVIILSVVVFHTSLGDDYRGYMDLSSSFPRHDTIILSWHNLVLCFCLVLQVLCSSTAVPMMIWSAAFVVVTWVMFFAMTILYGGYQVHAKDSWLLVLKFYGFVLLFFDLFSYVPQIVLSIKLRSCFGLSGVYFLLTACGYSLYLLADAVFASSSLVAEPHTMWGSKTPFTIAALYHVIMGVFFVFLRYFALGDAYPLYERLCAVWGSQMRFRKPRVHSRVRTRKYSDDFDSRSGGSRMPFLSHERSLWSKTDSGTDGEYRPPSIVRGYGMDDHRNPDRYAQLARRSQKDAKVVHSDSGVARYRRQLDETPAEETMPSSVSKTSNSMISVPSDLEFISRRPGGDIRDGDVSDASQDIGWNVASSVADLYTQRGPAQAFAYAPNQQPSEGSSER